MVTVGSASNEMKIAWDLIESSTESYLGQGSSEENFKSLPLFGMPLKVWLAVQCPAASVGSSIFNKQNTLEMHGLPNQAKATIRLAHHLMLICEEYQMFQKIQKPNYNRLQIFLTNCSSCLTKIQDFSLRQLNLNSIHCLLSLCTNVFMKIVLSYVKLVVNIYWLQAMASTALGSFSIGECVQVVVIDTYIQRNIYCIKCQRVTSWMFGPKSTDVFWWTWLRTTGTTLCSRSQEEVDPTVHVYPGWFMLYHS